MPKSVLRAAPPPAATPPRPDAQPARGAAPTPVDRAQPAAVPPPENQSLRPGAPGTYEDMSGGAAPNLPGFDHPSRRLSSAVDARTDSDWTASMNYSQDAEPIYAHESNDPGLSQPLQAEVEASGFVPAPPPKRAPAPPPTVAVTATTEDEYNVLPPTRLAAANAAPERSSQPIGGHEGTGPQQHSVPQQRTPQALPASISRTPAAIGGPSPRVNRAPAAIPDSLTGTNSTSALNSSVAPLQRPAPPLPNSSRPSGAKDSRPWYHPELNRAKAEQFLRGRSREGDFIVRGSSQPGAVALSMFCRNKLRNYLLTKTPAGYIIDGKPLKIACNSLDEVVAHLHRTNDGTAGVLVAACPVGLGR